MNPKYSLITYIIKFDAEKNMFTLWDDKQQYVGENTNGRELGRDAWDRGAEAVKYDYDLTKDEEIPLKVRTFRYAQY